jgi:hypothetical protein
MSLLRSLEPLQPLRDPVFVASFASQFGGGSGAAAIEYLTGAWDAQPVAEIDPDECFDYTVRRPVAHTVDGERVIEWPLNRIYVAHGVDRDFILLPGIEPGMRWRAVVDAIVEALDAMACRSAVILGSRRGSVPHTRPTPIRLSCSPSSALALRFGQGPVVSNYEGPVNFNGVLGVGLRLAGLDVATVSALTPVYVAAEPDPVAVRALVSAIDQAFGTSTSLNAIEEACVQLNAATEHAVASTPPLATTVANLEQQYDWIRGGPPPKAEDPVQSAELPSGPELVAELERFLRTGGSQTGAA